MKNEELKMKNENEKLEFLSGPLSVVRGWGRRWRFAFALYPPSSDFGATSVSKQNMETGKMPVLLYRMRLELTDRRAGSVRCSSHGRAHWIHGNHTYHRICGVKISRCGGPKNVRSYENYKYYENYEVVFFQQFGGLGFPNLPQMVSHCAGMRCRAKRAEFAEFAEFGCFKHIIDMKGQPCTKGNVIWKSKGGSTPVKRN